MLFFRTKISANNEMMYRKGRKANEEGWSSYIADELFTEKEVHDMNLNMDYLEPVEIPACRHIIRAAIVWRILMPIFPPQNTRRRMTFRL